MKQSLVKLRAAIVHYNKKPNNTPALKVLTPNRQTVYYYSPQTDRSNRRFHWNIGLTFDIEGEDSFTLVIGEGGVLERSLRGSEAERWIRVSCSELLHPTRPGSDNKTSILDLRMSPMMVTLTYEIITVSATTDDVDVRVDVNRMAGILNGSNDTTIGDSTLSNILGDQINYTINIINYSTTKYGKTALFVVFFSLMAYIIGKDCSQALRTNSSPRACA